MKIEGKMILAEGIAKLVQYHLQNHCDTEESTFWTEAYQNCREQGYGITLSSGQATRCAQVSECRNSDSIKVYHYDSTEKDLELSHVPFTSVSEKAWRQAKSFGYGEYTACIKHIVNFLLTGHKE
jgi:hypothetical protein